MLSILIPTYNFDCTALVRDLQKEATTRHIPYEIIVGDDASTDAGVVENLSGLTLLAHCKVLRMSENQGRARIRNRLAEAARGVYLLFIDSDAQVATDDFLARYMQALSGMAQVVCGGVKNVSHLPSPDYSLRFRYEQEADRHRQASERQKHPYDQFTTFNFLIQRNLFLSIGFDDNLTRYGYEDVRLGHELQQRRVPVVHIDNALIHTGLDTNREFLEKSCHALQNLRTLSLSERQKARVSRMALRLEALHFAAPLRQLFRLVQPLLLRHLLGPRPSLHLFNAYKLGMYLGM